MTTAPLCLPYEVLYPPGCFGELDEWLRRRLLHTLTLMEQRPATALSGLGESRAERVGALRMVEHEEVEFGRLLQPALGAVGAAVAGGQAGSVALCIHDRTEVELSHLKAMKGLGPVGNPLCRGFLLQLALAVDEQGAAFGVLGARTWVRPAAQRGKAQQRRELPFEEKESAHWWRGIAQAEAQVGQAGLLLHVIDAEGDIFELLCRAASARYQLLVRAAHDRCVEGEQKKLWATLQALPPRGTQRLHLPARPASKGKPARAARDVELTLRFGLLLLRPPHGRQGPAVEVWGVLVREEAPPAGAQPLEWLLLTNVPVQTPEAAWGVVQCYRRRWLIEELHKALKTGCALEARQHEDRQTLLNVLALMLPVAVRLLRLRTLARTCPSAAATQVLEEAEVQVLVRLAPRLAPRQLPSPTPTLGEALYLIALLGGYMGSRSNPQPGWLILWRGYERLRERVEGFLLARSLDSSPA
ncbi:MAG TPA: IS4 family transposase [Myxococcus sp.]|nr:IS4 family transposase [Myxococcus sp.]